MQLELNELIYSPLGLEELVIAGAQERWNHIWSKTLKKKKLLE